MSALEVVTAVQTNDDFSIFPISQVDPDKETVDNVVLLGQVERILRSEELRSSEVLRRLLKFLANKYVSGETEELKEYIIAIEALGKSASYDPRHNSAVRTLVSRLRLKLASYYLREGQHDQVLIDLPKGRFKPTCELRASPQRYSVPSTQALPEDQSQVQHSKRPTRVMTAGMWAMAGIMVAVASEAIVHHVNSVKVNTSSGFVPTGLNASVEELWRPFLTTNRPMIVAIGYPLYTPLDIKNGLSAPKGEADRPPVKSDNMEPSRHYNAFGDTNAAFMIARLLGSRVQNLTVARTTDLSMREVANNNVVFLGIQNGASDQQIQTTPIELPLQPASEGIRNLRPGANEPVLFADHYSIAPSENGFVYTLVTLLPGPSGDNDVEIFTSSRARGYMAAVKAFTNPGLVGPLVAKLEETGGGQMPRYYQVLLKVQFRPEAPLEITYVLSRELHYVKKL